MRYISVNIIAGEANFLKCLSFICSGALRLVNVGLSWSNDDDREKMQYGQHVRELVQELKRSEGGSDLPIYNDQAVQGAIQDFQLHEQALREQVTVATNPSISDDVKRQLRPSLLLQKTACDRNKRGLLLYHMGRLDRIKELYHWQSHNIQARTTTTTAAASTTHGGTTTSNSGSSSSSSSEWKNLNPAEIEFLKSYQTMVARYTNAAIPELADLRSYTSHRRRPTILLQPHDRVLCRVVDDDITTTTSLSLLLVAGPIVLESGQTVTFQKGSTYFLLHSDVEEYIRAGTLQVLESEELTMKSY